MRGKFFSTAPLLGRGLGSTENLTRSVQSFQYESKHAHNHLLQTLSDTGLVGTVFALAFVLGSVWLCLQAVRKEKDSLAAALLAAWVMMNLHSLMEINFSVRGFKVLRLCAAGAADFALCPAAAAQAIRRRVKEVEKRRV